VNWRVGLVQGLRLEEKKKALAHSKNLSVQSSFKAFDLFKRKSLIVTNFSDTGFIEGHVSSKYYCLTKVNILGARNYATNNVKSKNIRR